MCKIEVLAQSFVMLIAGYETIGNTLHYAIYFLAKHQDVQTQAQEEIGRVVAGSVSYGNWIFFVLLPLFLVKQDKT